MNFMRIFQIMVLFAFILAGCKLQPSLVDENVTVINDTINPPDNIPEEIFDVKIDSLNCKWTVKTGDYNVKSDCVRAMSAGIAQGPVGARLELPILRWSTDNFDCGLWTHKTGALVTVGHMCVRLEGQPEKTNWTVDTGGDNCPTKSYFDNDLTHSVKIYKDDKTDPKNQDSKETVCQ
ncbi:MAG: hypothetical protein NTW67_04910 [Candidatus Woesearchaeota archaeon]|nr:hypothetical protein [Candidatus Woesearchaeota archaeon]